MNKLTQIALAASVSTTALASAAFAETRTETLSSNSLITIALVDAHHEHRNVFMDELFTSVLPAIEEVGGRLVATFETFDVEEGDYTPQHIMLLEWPSVEAFENAANDPRNLAVLDRRAEAMRDFTIGFFTIPEDVTLTLEDGVVYEFFAGIPAGPDTPTQLQTFFQNVIPTALEYGRADAMLMQPVENERNGYFRPIAGLATWPSAAHFEQFTETTVFRENIEAYRNPAFAELELINTYFVE